MVNFNTNLNIYVTFETAYLLHIIFQWMLQGGFMQVCRFNYLHQVPQRSLQHLPVGFLFLWVSAPVHQAIDFLPPDKTVIHTNMTTPPENQWRRFKIGSEEKIKHYYARRSTRCLDAVIELWSVFQVYVNILYNGSTSS